MDPERLAEAECMGCRHSLTVDYVASVTTLKFEEEYRQHRSAIELSKEMSMLPATQPLVEIAMKKSTLIARLSELKAAEKMAKSEVKTLVKDRTRICARILEIRDGTQPPAINTLSLEANLLKIRKKETKCKLHLGEIISDMRSIHKEIKRFPDQPDAILNETQSFVKRCSVVTDGECCRGFLSTAWKCGTCSTFACSKCHGVKDGKNDPTHVCAEDDVATVKMLSDGTKPCPTCGTLISYVSGCSQIWCPGCNGIFSWTTGKVMTGTIHNPHYYEYQRRNKGFVARQPGDVPGCGVEMPDITRIMDTLEQRDHKFSNVTSCWLSVLHITAVTMPIYPATNPDVYDNSDLRVKYLMKEITEDEMKKGLKIRLKRREKNNEVNQVLDMYVKTITDLFSTYVLGSLDTEKSLCNQTHAIRIYVNEYLKTIAKRYNNTVPIISMNWEVV